MMKLNKGAAATAAVLLLSACSGSNNEATPTTVPTTAALATTTTVAPMATTTTTTTTSTTTTTVAPTTTTAPTTALVAPVTTNFDPATVEGEIEAVIQADQAAFAICMAEFPTCDAEAANVYSVGAFHDGADDFVARENAAGVEVRNVDQRTLNVTAIEFRAGGIEALVEVCIRDNTTWERPGATAGTTETTKDGFYSSTVRYLVTTTADGWRLADSERLDWEPGLENDLCG